MAMKIKVVVLWVKMEAERPSECW